MSLKVYKSEKKDVVEAIAEIKDGLKDVSAKFIVFFSSSKFDPTSTAELFNNSFPNSETFGCTTSGEIVSGGMYKESIVAMAFEEDKVKNLKIEVLENLSSGINLELMLESYNSYFGDFRNLDIEKYYGLVLIDGMSGAEEVLMDSLGSQTNINIVGASAGDDLQFKATYVMHNGKAYGDAAVLAVVESGVDFDFIKTQSFNSTDKTLIPTKVNAKNREVIEFNNKPAAIAYSEALGVSVDEVSSLLMKHPVGLMVDGEPYVRSPQMILENNSMKFYCNVSEGMELNILESTDIVEDTKAILKSKTNGSNSISGIVNFNCILRTLELESLEKTDDYGKVFSNIPTVGFSTYGEEFIGHINQTATMLVLK